MDLSIYDVGAVFVGIAFLGFFIKESYESGLNGINRRTANDTDTLFKYIFIAILAISSLNFYVCWSVTKPSEHNIGPIVIQLANTTAILEKNNALAPGTTQSIVNDMAIILLPSMICIIFFIIAYSIGRLNRYFSSKWVTVYLKEPNSPRPLNSWGVGEHPNRCLEFPRILFEDDKFIYFKSTRKNYWAAINKENIDRIEQFEHQPLIINYLKVKIKLFQKSWMEALLEIVSDFWIFIYIGAFIFALFS